MSLDDKMLLIEQHRHEYGLNRCLQALGLSKGTWYYRQHRPDPGERDRGLKNQIRAIIEANPGYGYRPIQAELEAQTGQSVNAKRIRRVLHTYELGLPRNLPKGTPHPVQHLIRQLGSSVNRVQGQSFAPLEAFSTDFTELIYAQGHRKAQLMVLLDIASCWAGGWAVGPSANRALALRSLDLFHLHMVGVGLDLGGVVIHHDQDPVYTSHEWLHQLLTVHQARVSYAEHGARDNPWIESFWGRFKTENQTLLLEAETLPEVTQIVDQQMDYYNHDRRHSSLGQVPPWVFLQEHLKRSPTQGRPPRKP